MRRWGRLILFLALITQDAPALDLSAAGILNFTGVHFSPPVGSVDTTSYSAKLGLGFGALVSEDIDRVFSLELGALYVQRAISTSNTGNDETLTMLEIPLLLRLNLIPFVSFGAGGYYARALGNVNVTTSGTNFNETYDQANLSQNDFGLVGSVAAHLPILPTISLFVDLRGYLGLANLDSRANYTSSLLDFQVLAGARLSL